MNSKVRKPLTLPNEALDNAYLNLDSHSGNYISEATWPGGIEHYAWLKDDIVIAFERYKNEGPQLILYPDFESYIEHIRGTWILDNNTMKGNIETYCHNLGIDIDIK